MDLQRNLSLHFCNTFVDLTSDESMLGCSALLYSCDFYSSSSPGNSFFFFFFLRKDIRYPLTKILMNKNISQDYKVTHVAAVQPSSHPEGAVLSQVPQSGSAV